MPEPEKTPHFHIQYQGVTYDKGWPKTNTRPFRVYRDGKFFMGYPTRAAAQAAIAARQQEHKL